MTLDPIHVDNIARLAGAIAGEVDDADHDEYAARAWELLDPLRDGGEVTVEPVADHELRAADAEAVALAERPFDAVHGLDSGTLNPTTFKNGLTLDVTQAAMAADPSDLALHRDRTLVATVHSTDATRDYDLGWTRYDDGHSRRGVIQVPSVSRFEDEVVHELGLYLAESEHALDHANVVSDLLVLDGPLYPKRLFNWESRETELSDLAREAKPAGIVENYVRLVEEFVARDAVLVGFVKNTSSRYLVRTLGESIPTPWADDAGLFTRLLAVERDGERHTDDITFTSWFRSRGGSDRTMSAAGDAMGVERELDPEAYEVTFFVVYDPREDLLFKVEAPYAVTRDPETRDRLTRYVVGEVAAQHGPPAPVEKADELARIGVAEKEATRTKFEERFGADAYRTYDDARWHEHE
ncbi:MAG: DNA double-strand break repair nuclease NurA [Halolamina sp.]